MARKSLLWLQAGGCGGCSMAVIGTGAGGWIEELAASNIDLVWHPSLSVATGRGVLELFGEIEAGRRPLDILCIEGAIITGPEGSGRFNRLGGTGRAVMEIAAKLAERAGTVVAVGACAAFGGIPAGDPDPVGARAVQGHDGAAGLLAPDWRSRSGLPVVNLAGCAPHPGWITETLAALAADQLRASDLDSAGRPRFFADHLAHHGCSRNEFYEFKASAEGPGERGCLMEHLGCKATQAIGDCNQRRWNGYGSCTDGGFACISCTKPGFEATEGYLTTPKLAGIPVGLPLDMPKAWFIALAALSKSATPRRVRENARADRPKIAPSGTRPRPRDQA